MADRVIFCQWGSPRTGREEAAAGSLRDAVAYCQRAKEAGEIADYDLVFLDPHGGLGGFLLVKGEAGKLARLAMDPEWLDACFRGNTFNDRFGVIGGTTGDAVMPMVDAFLAMTTGG